MIFRRNGIGAKAGARDPNRLVMSVLALAAALLTGPAPLEAQTNAQTNAQTGGQTVDQIKQERDRLRRFGARMLNAKARELHKEGQHELALKLALAALPPENADAERASGHAGLATLDLILRGPVWFGPLDGGDETVTVRDDFSLHPAGRLLVAATEDGKARIWDLVTGMPIRQLASPLGAEGRVIHRAIFSPDGRTILTLDGVARTVERQPGEDPLAQLDRYEAAVATRISLWQTRDGAFIRGFEGGDAGFRSVRMSADGRQVIAIDGEGVVKRWLTETGEALPAMDIAGDQVSELLLSTDGQRLLTRSKVSVTREATFEALLDESKNGEEDKSIVSIPVPRAVWSFDKLALLDGETGAKLWEIPRFGGDFQPLQFSPDRQVIFGINDFGWALLLDAATGKTIGEYVREDAEGRVSPIEHGVYSPDGQKIMTGHGDGTLRIWNAAGGWIQSQIKVHDAAVTHVAFSPDEQWALSLSAEGVGRLIRLSDDFTAPTNQDAYFLKGIHGKLIDIRFAPDGGKIIGLTEEREIHVWRTPDTKGAFVNTWGWKMRGQTLATPDGQWLLTTSLFPGIRFLKTDLWGSLRPLESQGDASSQWDAIFASPDGKRIITEDGGEVNLWDWTTGKAIRSIGGGNLYNFVLGLSPNGKQAALWDANARKIQILNTQDGQPLRELTGFEKDVLRGVYSHDSKLFAIASMDGSARLWDMDSGAELLRLEHDDWVRHVSFGPENKRLLTASKDGTARLWDVASGRELARFRHGDPVNEAVFDKAGRRIATITEQGTVHVWDLSSRRRLRTFYGNGGDWGFDMLIFDDRLLAVLPHGMVYDAGTDQTLMDLGEIVNFGLSPDGLWLAAYSENDIFLADVEEILAQDNLARAVRAMARDPLTAEETSAFHLDYWAESFQGDDVSPTRTPPRKVNPCLKDPYDAVFVVQRQLDNPDEAPTPEARATATAKHAACVKALKNASRDGRLRLQLAASLTILGRVDEAWDQIYMARGLGRPEAERILDRLPDLTGDPVRMTAYFAAIKRTLALGAPEAANVMAELLWHGGASLPQDREKALALFRDAMVMGSPRAHLRLANLHGVGLKPAKGDNGPEVKRDLPRALFHYAMAARLFQAKGMEEKARRARYRQAYMARSLPRHLVAEVWKEIGGK